jgi:hypothetical protein
MKNIYYKPHALNTIKQNKIPEIILSVKKQLLEGDLELSKIDIYVDFLCDLSEKECFFLNTNRSSNLYENDMDLLLETLNECFKPYEEVEEYEFCQRILENMNRYKKYLSK